MFVEITDDHITIYRKLRKPGEKQPDDVVVTWDKSEWVADPSIVVSIANAIKMAYFKPTELIKTLGKIRRVDRKKAFSKRPNIFRLHKIGPQKYTLIVNESGMHTWNIFTDTLDNKISWCAETNNSQMRAYREYTKKELIQRILDHYNMTPDDRHRERDQNRVGAVPGI